MYIADLAAYSQLASSKSSPTAHTPISVQRAPTDPYFYADVTLQNVVVDSLYWLAQDSNSTMLKEGTVTSNPFTILTVPSYASPMLMKLRLRKRTGSPDYITYVAYAYHGSGGVTIYCAQVINTIT